MRYVSILLTLIKRSQTKLCLLLVRQVIRTRLRQPLVNGKMKYTGLLQTLQLVIREEGARSLYGGLSAHLMRVVPNAAVMYAIYEGVLRWGAANDRLEAQR